MRIVGGTIQLYAALRIGVRSLLVRVIAVLIVFHLDQKSMFETRH